MIQLQWVRHAQYAAVRVSGTPLLDHALSALDVIAAEAVAGSRLLIDLRGVTTLHSFTDQFALGHAAAATLRHLERVASLVPEGRATRNSERPARRQGLDLQVFESEARALAWLLEVK